MNASGPNYFMLRLALPIAPLAIVDRAQRRARAGVAGWAHRPRAA